MAKDIDPSDRLHDCLVDLLPVAAHTVGALLASLLRKDGLRCSGVLVAAAIEDPDDPGLLGVHMVSMDMCDDLLGALYRRGLDRLEEDASHD